MGAFLAYLWLVGNGRMVVMVVIIVLVPFLHSLLTKGKLEGFGLTEPRVWGKI